MSSTKKKTWAVVAVIAVILAGTALYVALLFERGVLQWPPQPEASAAPSPAAELSPAPTPTPAATPSPAPTPSATPAPIPYFFGEPLAETEPVEDSWFDDAVFLGDSRTEGLQIYSGLKTGTFFCYRGLSVFTAKTKACVNVGGKTLTLLEAINTNSWNKVYIMFGLNELGYPAATFEEGLLDLLDMVRTAQPEAVIYLQTLPPVNEGIARAKGSAAYVNNEKVDAFNEVVARAAREKKVVLLDVATVLRNEAGILDPEHTADGVHFRRLGYQTWLDYLRRHTMEKRFYTYSQQAPQPEPAPVSSAAPEESGAVPPADASAPVVTSLPTPMPTAKPTPAPSPTPAPAPTSAPEPAPAPAPAPAPDPTPQPTHAEENGYETETEQDDPAAAASGSPSAGPSADGLR